MEALTTPANTVLNNIPSNSAVFSDKEIFSAVAMMAAVVVFGTILNTLVISVLCIKNSSANSRWNRYRRQQRNNDPDHGETGAFGRDKTLDFFILVLAVSDLLVCVIIIPATIMMEITQFRLSIDILCKLYYVLFVTNTTFSSLLISAVAFDRYLFICHSLKHILTLMRAKILVSTLALFSLGVGIAAGCVVSVKPIHPNFAGDTNRISDYICEENEYMHGISDFQKIVSQIIKYFNHAWYLACILIVLILYSCVFWAIVSTRSRSHKLTVSTAINRLNSRETSYERESSSNITVARQRMTSIPSIFRQKAQFTFQNFRSALMLFIIALVYILTFVPALVIANGWAQQNLVLLYLYYVNSAANPCIYAIFTPSFRRNLAALLRSCCLLKENSAQSFRCGGGSMPSEIGSSIPHANSLARTRLRSKRRTREDAFPFITREQRRAAATMKAAADSLTATAVESKIVTRDL